MSDELEGPLRTLVGAMRHIAVSADSLQRALNRAKQIDRPGDRIRQVGPLSSAGKTSAGQRWRRFAAAAAALSVVIALGLVFAPTKSLGWADVSNALQAQRWIHLRNGGEGEIWVSPAQKVWAFKVNSDWIMFGDETQRARYEFRRRRNPLTKTSLGENLIKTSLGEDGVARMLPLNDLSGNGAAVQPWIKGTTKINDQKRREVTEGGKRWIEFELTLSPLVGRMYRGTLRVDPTTGLPVSLLERSDSDAQNAKKWEHKWEFDYPDRGPTSIYDLGVARDLAIDDRMPSNEVLSVLDAMAASRARIGDFRLVVFQSDAGAMRSIQFPYVVCRKGELWRVDQSLPEFRPVGGRPAFGPAAGQSWDDWLERRLKQTGPRYLCDGKTVYKNSERLNSGMVKWQSEKGAPQDLLSGDRSARSLSGNIQFVQKVYPDLAVPQGWTFEFDPRPADTEGCVLIRISAELAGGRQRGHEWYYIDPAKGHAVVRTEMFNLQVGEKPDNLPADRQTIRMEDFRQSPTGFWYPTAIHETRAGADTTIQYRFDFDAELPDSLFVVEMPE